MVKKTHGGNAGSNPAGDANILKNLWELTLSLEGSKGFDKEKTPDSAHLVGGLLRQNHSHDSGLRLALRFGHRLDVDVGGDLVIRVTQEFLNGFDVFAIRLHECSEGMPERVPTDTPRDSGRFERFSWTRNNAPGQYGCLPRLCGLGKIQSSGWL